MMSARVLIWPLVFVGCLVLVFTQTLPPPGACPNPDEIPELCSVFSCRPILDCNSGQLCCPINCAGVSAGSRCADPVPFTTSTTSSATSSTTTFPGLTTTPSPSTSTSSTQNPFLTTTTQSPFPTISCANIRCQASSYCCLRSVQCFTSPCPRQPECVADPCRFDPCIAFGTCIRICDFCESCQCISRNPCDSIRCPFGTECDPTSATCIAIDICQILACPRGSVCDPVTGSCNNICRSVGSRYVSRSQPFCVCEPQEVCLGFDADSRGSCCEAMFLPTSAAYKPTAVLLPWLFLASIAYLTN